MGMFDKPKTAVAKKTAAPVAKGVFKRVAAAPSRSRDEDEEIDGDDDDSVAAGWGGAKAKASEYSNYANRLDMKEQTLVGKFLNDTGPYATVATHWIETGTGKNKKRNGYQCPGARTCPLCAVGDKATVRYHFNVIILTEEKPVLYSFEQGIRTFRKIEALGQDAKYGPLTKMYYEITRTGMTANDTEYSFRAVRKISDLDEEYPDLVVPSQAEFDKVAAKAYTKGDALKNKASINDLKKVAAIISGDEDEDED